jgi:hypothetical protein
VQAGAGSFASDVETRDIGACTQVADDATTGIMRGRDDRDRLAGNVDTQFEAARQNVREVLGRKAAGLCEMSR